MKKKLKLIFEDLPTSIDTGNSIPKDVFVYANAHTPSDLMSSSIVVDYVEGHQ